MVPHTLTAQAKMIFPEMKDESGNSFRRAVLIRTLIIDLQLPLDFFPARYRVTLKKVKGAHVFHVSHLPRIRMNMWEAGQVKRVKRKRRIRKKDVITIKPLTVYKDAAQWQSEGSMNLEEVQAFLTKLLKDAPSAVKAIDTLLTVAPEPRQKREREQNDDAPPRKKAQKEQRPKASVDKWGAREGTRAAKINEVITKKVLSLAEITKLSKQNAVASHLRSLVKKGLVLKTTKGYKSAK